MSKIIDLSDYIISYFEKRNKKITNLKLQKILYYIQGYCLKNDIIAFKEDIYNWPYGPVVLDSYFEYSNYRGNPISKKTDKEFFSINRNILNIADKILEVCINIPDFELVEKTRSEKPWLTTKRNSKIPTDKIKKFFCNNDPLNILI